MAYYDVAMLRQDADFLFRVTACYAIETLSNPQAEEPNAWTNQHSWDIASAPGFGEKYAYAVANGNPNPGKDTSVIPDEDILAAVQFLLSQPDQGA